MAEKPVIVIEHLEDGVSPWIFMEYRHSSIIAGRDNLYITNVPKRYHQLLGRYGGVTTASVVELVSENTIPADSVIVLDPKAPKGLEEADLPGSYIVIGGILGDHPPRGRTWRLLTSRLIKYGVRARNIGDKQYSIDGTVYYVITLWRTGLKGFEYIDGVDIETPSGVIHLPFRYPLAGGKPLLAPGLREYLVYGRIPDFILREVGLSR